MITNRMSPDVRFFCYICGVGFDFMCPVSVYRFSGTGFFLFISIFSVYLPQRRIDRSNVTIWRDYYCL